MQFQLLRLFRINGHAHLLEIEDNVSHILKHTMDGGKLMLHIVYLYGSKGRTLKRGQQYTPQGVTNGCSESAFQRLADKTTMHAIRLFLIALHPGGLDKLGPVQRIDEAIALFV